MSKTLVAKLAEVMAAVERVPKRGRNDFHKYDYATEADIVATVRQELASRSVVLLPAIDAIAREPVGEKGSVLTTLTMSFTFLDGETSESLTRPWAGCGTDKEDKGLYKAMTGGEKYFLLKTFLMPTGDDPEATAKVSARARREAVNDTQQVTVEHGTAVDTDSGTELPACPPGYHYVTGYKISGDWHEATLLAWDLQGGSLKVSTKYHAVAALLLKAANERIPAKCDVMMKKQRKGEAYVNKIELLKAKPSITTSELEPATPVTADQIPF